LGHEKARALLVALRDPDDPMLAHERMCFAERSGLPLEQVHVHPMVHGRPDRAKLQSYDVLFFGGSGAYSVLDNVPWIHDGLAVLQEVVDLGKKSWASCFGFQGLSLAMGGTVIHDDDLTEMGATQLTLTPAGRADPILSVLPEPFWAEEGHHDHVIDLPNGVTLLATGSKVRNQAFKVNGIPFYASQFHPELTVQRTLDRFIHYRDHYIEEDADAVFAMLAAGQDTPEVGQLLRRLVEL
jgi:GMP synthase (glutamine-hydrolysing)